MALFRDLIGTIASAESVSEMTVTGIGQYLRDAGLISKHGRGKSAARMTTADAANLLIGVNASDLAKNAVAAVAAYGELQLPYPEKTNIEHWSIAPAFQKGVKLKDAIRIVLDAFVPDESGNTPIEREIDGLDYSIEIGFGAPVISAFIRVSQIGPPSIANPFRWMEMQKTEAFGHYWDRRYPWSSSSGRKSLTVIDKRTLSAVGIALAN